MCACDWNTVCSKHRGTRWDHWYWYEAEPKRLAEVEQAVYEQAVRERPSQPLLGAVK